MKSSKTPTSRAPTSAYEVGKEDDNIKSPVVATATDEFAQMMPDTPASAATIHLHRDGDIPKEKKLAHFSASAPTNAGAFTVRPAPPSAGAFSTSAGGQSARRQPRKTLPTSELVQHVQGINSPAQTGPDLHREPPIPEDQRGPEDDPANYTGPTGTLAIAAEVVPHEEEIEAQVEKRVREKMEIEAQAEERVRAQMGNSAPPGSQETKKKPFIKRWMIWAILVVVAIVVVVVVVVLVTGGSSSSSDSSPPTAAPVLQAARYGAGWSALSNDSCEGPQPGLRASCGPGGTIRIDSSGTTSNVECTPAGEGTLSCQAVLNDANDNFAALFYECIGTSDAAWTSEINAIPDTSVQCSTGGTAGTAILLDQTCGGEDIDTIQMQCNPASSFVSVNEGASGCFLSEECNNFSCNLSTPPVGAHIDEAAISKRCLVPASGRRSLRSSTNP